MRPNGLDYCGLRLLASYAMLLEKLVHPKGQQLFYSDCVKYCQSSRDRASLVGNAWKGLSFVLELFGAVLEKDSLLFHNLAKVMS